MCRKFITFLLILAFGISFSQWNPAVLHTEKVRPEVQVKKFYSLNIQDLKTKLNNAQPTGKNAAPVVVQVPVLEGKSERFAVYSSPVVVPELAEKYGLGSYVGFGIDDPQKRIRFSLSGNDFQSMIVKNGEYQFIEPQDQAKTVYGVFPKTNRNKSGNPFVCSTEESTAAQQQIEALFNKKNNTAYNSSIFAKTSDQKFRKFRIAISVTGEYTQHFGGVNQAMAAINATMTRVNGILESDLSVQLIVQNFPELIYTNPDTDPYSPASSGTSGNWSKELQNNLTATIGNSAYDLGHLFGASGGGGDAGCIGCVCEDNVAKDVLNKGSAFTSPRNGEPPAGDVFDIDFVIHEIGHQLGATHTFSHSMENLGTSVEPGTGSTIMGYSGVGGAHEVQPHTDPYFHGTSIEQIQNNLANKTCAQVTAISGNTPPSIIAMGQITIPRSTAFVLTATASDNENDALTFAWEQIDNATSPVIQSNLGTTLTGPIARSFPPTGNPLRYIPSFSSVMAGNLTDPDNWESVSTVARNTNFRVTVRDNHPQPQTAQVAYEDQRIVVGSDGPFKLFVTEGQNFFAGISNNLTWDVVKTNAAPYNVTNVKISYTTDNGSTWINITESTPNDGGEIIVVPNALLGQNNLQFRVEAIGNIFYAVSPKINVVAATSCVVTVPYNIKISNITGNSATATWEAIPNIASYIFEYRRQGEAEFMVAEVTKNSLNLQGLLNGTTYEYRMKSNCPNSASEYSTVQTFTTLQPTDCFSGSSDGTYEYIRKVEVDRYSNTSGPSSYTNFGLDPNKTIVLNRTVGSYSIRVSPKWLADPSPVNIAVWIDFNGDNILSDSERILSIANTTEPEVIASFQIPENASTSLDGVKMRVSLSVGEMPEACGSFAFGEVEDYKVMIEDRPVFYGDSVIAYPNPFSTYVYTTNVADGTEFKIYDMSGRLLKSGQIFLNKIDLSYLKPGVYLLVIEGKKAIKILKKE